MKKIRLIVSVMLVFAMCMGLCACQKPVETGATGESEGPAATAVSGSGEESMAPSESAKETAEDPWNGIPDAGNIVGATALASQCLGKNVDEVLSSGTLNDFWAGDGGCAFSRDMSRQAMIPEEGYRINGYEFDQIYLWKDGENISRVTFMTRHNEYMPTTEAEIPGAEGDMDYDALGAMFEFVPALEAVFGDYRNKGGTDLEPADGDSFLFEHNGTEISVTYAVDCYGIEGNNEFRIDVYPSGSTFAGVPEEDLKILISKLSYCMGKDKDTAKAMAEAALGVEFTNEQIDNTGYIYYTVDTSVEGVGFNQIIMKTNEEDGQGQIYEIDIVNDMDSFDKAPDHYELFKEKLKTIYGDAFIPWNHPAYEGVLMRVDSDGCYCITGGMFRDGYCRFYLIMNNESLREE